jgi:hypothetical protein
MTASSCARAASGSVDMRIMARVFMVVTPGRIPGSVVLRE